jgi:hypothetical protein
MKTFIVHISRRFYQYEAAAIKIEAINVKEARYLAMKRASSGDDTLDWEPSDGEYDQYSIEEVENQS